MLPFNVSSRSEPVQLLGCEKLWAHQLTSQSCCVEKIRCACATLSLPIRLPYVHEPTCSAVFVLVAGKTAVA